MSTPKISASIEDNCLVLRIPLKREPTPSGTGKTLIVASTDGPKRTTAMLGELPISVRAIAWIPRKVQEVEHDPTA